MTKQISARRPVQGRRPRQFSGLSLLIFLAALVGVVVAAFSREPVVWMLRWPLPLVVTFTLVNFVRQGFHKRDGLLVLGRATVPASSRRTDPGGLADAVNEQERVVLVGNEPERMRRPGRKPRAGGKRALEAVSGRHPVFSGLSRPRSTELGVPGSLAWAQLP